MTLKRQNDTNYLMQIGEAIQELARKKYKNWDWNYGKSPKYEYNRSERLSSGTVDITISVEQNRIADCRIFGDFFWTR